MLTSISTYIRELQYLLTYSEYLVMIKVSLYRFTYAPWRSYSVYYVIVIYTYITSKYATSESSISLLLYIHIYLVYQAYFNVAMNIKPSAARQSASSNNPIDNLQNFLIINASSGLRSRLWAPPPESSRRLSLATTQQNLSELYN